MAEYVFSGVVEHEDGGLSVNVKSRPCERIVRCRDCGRAYRRGGGVYCSRVLQWGEQRQTGSSAGGSRRILRVGRKGRAMTQALKPCPCCGARVAREEP